MNKNKFVPLILLIIISFDSCKVVSDEKPDYCKLNDRDYSFSCFTNHLEFSYHSILIYSADTETILPLPFTICLPSNLKQCRFFQSQDFVFYYKNNQTIYIKIDINSKTNVSDTIYFPSKNQLETIIYNADDDLGKFKDGKIKASWHRKNLVVVQDNALILLYNVKKRNFKNYFELIKSFKIVKQ